MAKHIIVFDMNEQEDCEKLKVVNQADAMYFAFWELQSGAGRTLWKYEADEFANRIADLLKSAPEDVKEAVIEEFYDFNEKWHDMIWEVIKDHNVDTEIYP